MAEGWGLPPAENWARERGGISTGQLNHIRRKRMDDEAAARRAGSTNAISNKIYDGFDTFLNPGMAEGMANVADVFVPGVGGAITAEDSLDMFREADSFGDYAMATGMGVMAGAELLPMLGKPLAKGGKQFLKNMNNIGPVPRMNANIPMISDKVDAPFDMGRGFGDNSGITRKIDSIDLPAGSDPRYRGAAVNRTTPFARQVPDKLNKRTQSIMDKLDSPDDPIHTSINAYLARGEAMNGADWYNTEEMRDWFVEELGEEAGDAGWREFMSSVAHTSTGSEVPQNIRNASFYYMLDPEDRVKVATMVRDTPKVEGVRLAPRDAADRLGIEVPNVIGDDGYGHKMHRAQAGNVINDAEGRWAKQPPDDLKGAERTKWLQSNNKVKGFGNDLIGDDVNIAADKHYVRIMGMLDGSLEHLSGGAELSAANRKLLKETYGDALDKYVTTRTKEGKTFTTVNLKKAVKDGVITDNGPFSDMPTAWNDMPSGNEYNALEEAAGRLAAARGLTPAQFQAQLWMGAGDVTGLADGSQGTFMDLLRRAADKQAARRGVTRKEQILDLIHKRAPLALLPGAASLPMLSQEETQNGAY